MRIISEQRIYLHCPLRKWSFGELIETQLNNKVLLLSELKAHAYSYRKSRSLATYLLLLVRIFIPRVATSLAAGLAVSHLYYSIIACSCLPVVCFSAETMSTATSPILLKWDPKSLEIRTLTVERLLEPLVTQVGLSPLIFLNIALFMQILFLCWASAVKIAEQSTSEPHRRSSSMEPDFLRHYLVF